MLSSILKKNLPLIIFGLYVVISDNWRKVNNAAVCFGARNNKYGAFNIKENGFIYTFKLVHKNGSLRCNSFDPASYWGCTHPDLGDKKLLTVITYPNKTALLLADYFKDASGEPKATTYSYQIAGIGVNSKELEFNKLHTPLSVTGGQEFQIWYGQDLVDRSEHNNAGQTCADVFAWYTELFTVY